MKAKDNKTDQQRRKFLRGTVATGAGAVIAASSVDAVVAATPEPTTDKADGKQGGYRLSQHILDYYKTCVR